MPHVVTLKTSHHQTVQHKLKKLCEWIELNIDASIGWAELTEHSGMGHLELQREFVTHLNTTPMQWIRMRRRELSQTTMAEQFLRKNQLPETLMHKTH